MQGNAPADYQYDVFISYRRDDIIEEWLDGREFFSRLLLSYLRMELCRPARVFRDKVNLTAGDNFHRKLEHALKHSRCLVPIGTGDYFSSAWCRSEFETFADRSIATGGGDLIVPVAWHDWSPAPMELGQIQISSFHQVAFVGAREDPKKVILFQECMKDFCVALAKKILNAPPFDPSWAVTMPAIDDVLPPRIKRPRDPE